MWPGYDLRQGRDEFHYGFLPPRFYDKILVAARAVPQAQQNDSDATVNGQAIVTG